MNGNSKAPEHERRDWIIILIILLLGFLCVILAAQLAIRFSPTWKLNTNMQSNLDPNSDFLTNRPFGFFEPLDPSIITQPVWFNVYLTPGASVEARSPVPHTNTPIGTNTSVPIASNTPTVINTTNTPTVKPITPTNTPIYYPPPPSTNTARPPATNTPIPPLPVADLFITKDDGVTFVNTSDTVTYTVRITNNGPSNVTGAVLSDAAASGLTKTAIACSPTTPGQCVTPPTIAQLQGGTFALPTLNSGQFYEITITADITALSGNVTNTATINVPSGINDPNAGNNSAADTDTVTLTTDLQITKTDNATEYVAGATKTYYIDVYNAGPSDVTGATVTDLTLTNATNPNIANASWTCSSITGGSCTAGGSGNIIDMAVNLPVGSTVTYEVTVTVVGAPAGNLVNIASVVPPAGTTDTNNINDSATDIDNLIIYDTLPSGDIGILPDDIAAVILEGNSVTFAFGTPLVVGTHAGFDLIYYELQNGTGIAMDLVQIQISDGSNWYTIFYWGDGAADTNSNLNINVIGGVENDNRDFTTIPASDILYPFNSGTLSDPATGITIELDGFVPPGSYPYIRIISPLGGNDPGIEVDAIVIVP